ncbi:MAG: hypothetical protein C0412_10335, partial [Flavobacterium sp.]|nr:hypothetical protein [Flavobacterium sp.]
NFKFVGKEKATYFVTNLCNAPLIHAPPKKIVYIPEIEATAGYKEIIEILDSSKINLIFSMSLQVNYWLQKLNLYNSDGDFLNLASPRSKGVKSDPPYYENIKGTPFLAICLKEHQISRNGRFIRIIPVLHTKHWSLNNGFVSGSNSMRKYREIYETYKNGLRNELFA